MKPELATAIAEAFREHRDAFGVSITFGAATVTAIVGESDLGRELVGGGFAEVGDLKCKLLLADLQSPLALGNPATYKGRNFKVSSLSVQPGSLLGEVNLRPAKR